MYILESVVCFYWNNSSMVLIVRVNISLLNPFINMIIIFYIHFKNKNEYLTLFINISFIYHLVLWW